MPLIAAVELRITSRLQTLVWQIGATLEQERELGPLEQLWQLNKPRSLQTFSAAPQRDLGRANFGVL